MMLVTKLKSFLSSFLVLKGYEIMFLMLYIENMPFAYYKMIGLI